jgi:aspartate aminotransferase
MHHPDMVSLNLQVRGLALSATLAINEQSAELERAGRHVYRQGLGQSPFPVPERVVEALRQNAAQKDYLPVQGLPALRQAVAGFHRERDEVEVKPENVLVGPGSKELLFLLQLVYYGDLIVPTPCWVSYVPQAQIIGRPVKLVHTTYEERWRMTPERLETMCRGEDDPGRPRILVLNYPGNPEGGTYTAGELEEIAALARKYDILILSDEIYGRLHHTGGHVSIARFYPEGTIISSGLSKWCGAGGWRLGTFAFPPELRRLMKSMAAVASETYTSVSAPIQYAAVAAFEGGEEIDAYLAHSRRILSAVGRHVVGMYKRAGIRVHSPDGAFYLFLDFTPLARSLAEAGITDSVTLCRRLLDETGVAILPGAAFGRHPQELTARLSYVNFDGAAALVASEALPLDRPLSDEFLAAHLPGVVEAAERLVGWVETTTGRTEGDRE